VEQPAIDGAANARSISKTTGKAMALDADPRFLKSGAVRCVDWVTNAG
jgi:hypothetical protein